MPRGKKKCTCLSVAHPIVTKIPDSRVIHHSATTANPISNRILLKIEFSQLAGMSSNNHPLLRSNNPTVRSVCSNPNGQLTGIRGAAISSVSHVMFKHAPIDIRRRSNILICSMVQLLGYRCDVPAYCLRNNRATRKNTIAVNTATKLSMTACVRGLRSG